MKQLFLFICVVLLSGCATLLHSKTVDTPRAEIAPGRFIWLPKPSQLAFNVKATQILTAQYKINNQKKSYTSQVQVEKTPKKLVMVAVAGWGGEVFSVDYDGVTVKTSSLPMPKAALGIKYVLTDFIFTYASDAELETLLKPTDIKLRKEKRQRVLMLNDKPIIKIHYQYDNPWKGRIVLHNLRFNYTITITTVSSSHDANL